jgi:uncharacterized repeat protein (TIGR01451 family)
MISGELFFSRWLRRLRFYTVLGLLIALVGCRGANDAGDMALPLAPSSAAAFRMQEEVAPQAAEDAQSQINPEFSEPLPVAPIEPCGRPLPRMLVTPWKPPGIACPWPEDEWIHDGGDREVHVNLTEEPAVRGLDLEDTVVHADTAHGCKLIEPSNRVHLYAPRFLAVRKVTSVVLNQQNEKAGGTELPVAVVQQEEKLLADAATQPVQPIADVGVKQLSISRLQEPAGRVVKRVMVADMQDAVMPYENLQIIKLGIFEHEEEALLAERVQAAITWSHDKAVQVVIDGRAAEEVVGDQRAQATFRIDEPCNPRLRVIKVASTQVARPGDIVDFTIRFDNTGDQLLTNVTLLDNLTTRLEYVADSAQASLDAEFNTQQNEGDSLVLRWDFKEPLKPGDGGMIRFQCRVR